MATTIYVKDLADIVQYVVDELKLDPNDGNEVARIKRDINAIYLDEVVPFKNWQWLSGNTSVEFTPYISYGTVAVTPGSPTITFTVAPIASAAGKYFAVDGFDEIYTIASHTAGSLTATLSSSWTGVLNTAGTYKVWSDQIALPTDLRETVSVWHNFMPSPMEPLGIQDFRRRVAESPRVQDRPKYYVTYDYFDPTPGSEVGRYRVMKVYPSINDTSTTIHLDYMRDAAALQLDGDEPLMKEEDRIVLVYGALARAWLRARNLESAAHNQQMYDRKLGRMAGKVEDSSDKPTLSPNSLYLSRKRARPTRPTTGTPFNGGSSYTAPTYLKNVVIAGAQVTDNVTVASGKTIDGRDLSADGSALDSHLAAGGGKHAASQISNTPSGNQHSTDVQSAINSLQTSIDSVASAGLTQLTGDVTAAGPGASAAVVVKVGTSTAANVHAAEQTVNNAQTGNVVFASPSGGGSGAPAFRTLVAADLPLPTPTTVGGVKSSAAVSHQFVTQVGTDGSITKAQPAFSDVSGSVAASQLPTPTSTTLGGVKSAAAVLHQFVTQVGTDGSIAQAQPAFTDISGTIAAGQVPTLNQNTTGTATNVTGTVAIANGGTGQVTAGAAINALLPTQASNSGKFLKTDGTNPSWVAGTFSPTAPTLQKFTSGSGTYTTPAGVLYIKVRMAGGGGGGSGSGTASGGSGGGGGNTTFGTSLLVANGGSGGVWGSGAGTGGGTASLGTGPVGIALQGGPGGSGGYTNSTAAQPQGGSGGVGLFGGVGQGGGAGNAGLAAITNSGAGGGGGGASGVTACFSGNGGGAGGIVDAIIFPTASQTFAYGVGGAGTAGTLGTSGSAGGAGGSGVIIVEEFYQ